MDNPSEMVHLQLGWHHDAPAVRRKDFPSWSWAGWEGPALQTEDILNFGASNILCEPASLPKGAKAGFHFLQEVLRGEFQRSNSLRSLRLTPRLAVQGPMARLEFRIRPADDAEVLSGTTEVRMDSPGLLWRHNKSDWAGSRGFACTMTRKSGLHCYFELNDDVAVLVPVYLDTLFPTEEVGQVFGLLVGNGDSEREEDVEQRVLVVKRCGECWERQLGYVGLILYVRGGVQGKRDYILCFLRFGWVIMWLRSV